MLKIPTQSKLALYRAANCKMIGFVINWSLLNKNIQNENLVVPLSFFNCIDLPTDLITIIYLYLSMKFGVFNALIDFLEIQMLREGLICGG